jgi:serine/threonine-protein kinase HipA
MASAAPQLLVMLGADLVGRITLVSYGSPTADQIEFAFEAVLPRPILSQFFEDDLTRIHSSRMRVPPFFSNLLPEGPLRKLIAKRRDVSENREFFLLEYTGEDLPGAVVVRAESPVDAPPLPPETPRPLLAEASPLPFSLSGMQPKFSMIREGRSLTLPASGRGGDWLVKLPDARAQLVPENEYSMMRWAKEVGLDVPEMELVSPSKVSGLPSEVGTLSGQVFAIRRFDRPAPDKRVHIEDFAQVLGLYAPDKYESANYETVGNIILRLGGPRDLEEFVARLVFITAIGNGDAHLKNWSLIYPDRVSARLSPVYDFVSTIQYIENDALGLNFAGSKRFENVSLASFEKFAKRLKLDPAPITAKVRATVEATLDAWSKLRSELPIPAAFKSRLDSHLARVPLFHR